jgi:hypothetical protein
MERPFLATGAAGGARPIGRPSACPSCKGRLYFLFFFIYKLELRPSPPLGSSPLPCCICGVNPRSPALYYFKLPAPLPIEFFWMTCPLLAASWEITVNVISLHFAKKFTQATYRVRIRHMRCLRKALSKYHSISKNINININNLTRYSLPKTQKTKIWFQGILGVNLDFLTELGFSHLLFVGPLVLSKDCNVKRSRLVPISNHQTSKFSRFWFKTQNFL